MALLVVEGLTTHFFTEEGVVRATLTWDFVPSGEGWFEGILAGPELVEKLKAQTAPFNPTYHLGEQVVKLEKNQDGWKVTTSKNTIIQCKAVFIAAGCGAFGPNRPPLAGLEAYESTSVFYLVSRREDLRGKRVVIAGVAIPRWIGRFRFPSWRRKFTSSTAAPNSAAHPKAPADLKRWRKAARWNW